MKNISILIFLGLIVGCTSSPTDEITGKWFMYKVIQNEQDVTSEHNPYNERYLTLKVDSSFESGGRPYGENTGKYVFNEKENTLFLDSDAGPDDDSHWNVTISNDTMYWQGYGSEWAENFRIVQIREIN